MFDELDILNLVLGVIFSTIGFGYFIYGKRQQHSAALIAGLLLMLYPYIVSGTMSLIVVGLLLVAGPFVASRMGW
jgi:hypothetical protein